MFLATSRLVAPAINDLDSRQTATLPGCLGLRLRDRESKILGREKGTRSFVDLVRKTEMPIVPVKDCICCDPGFVYRNAFIFGRLTLGRGAIQRLKEATLKGLAE